MSTYSQAGRKFRVETPLGPDELLLERFTGEEAISTPFLFTLHVVSENDAIDPAALLRKPVSVTLELPDGDPRVIHGLVRRVVQLDRSGPLTNYRVEVVPWLWFLSLSSDCRIFQEMTATEIIEQVFKDLGMSDFKLQCIGSYAKRDYCVQYRESHLDFVSRLMEEEGIFYFFEHTASKHTLVLADAKSAVKPCPGQAEARMSPQANPSLHEDVVLDAAFERVARTGKVSLTDYNFLTPASSLDVTVNGREPEEVYDYPGEYAARPDGERYASLRLDAHEAGADVLSGSGTCRAFQPGYRFALKGHYRRDRNAQYLITRVTHSASSGGFGTDRGAEEEDYRNAFEAIPYDVPFRPLPATPRPIVHGTQTAVVVGKAGEEIWVDKYGRVKVQFHWDRVGKKDEHSSCWVRVASTWAGKQWGAIQLPRIGQEVVVDFLEGDPDRPIVIGSVYNADQMPPYELPGDQTQSGVKSRSSKGGGAENFNEIRFEDKKGSELLVIHAEKDKQVTVEHDRTESVGNNESITIGNNRTESVAKNEQISIGENRTEDVGKNETIAIGENQAISVGKNQTLTVDADRTKNVAKNETIDVGANRTANVAQNDELTVGKKLVVSAGDEITLVTGSASITMKKDGTITIKGKDVTVTGSGKINVKASSNVVIKGSKVAAN
ncbi:MAG TPA: type VI secretion system tip protein TssI/VgrG [Gemmatimonadaceae bacterium]|nr:type VI secretion system tip protein TssI/VgrG [Gemmatimonadaceae bacterium]